MKINLTHIAVFFWSKVDFSKKCWNWQAGLGRGGYGQFSNRIPHVTNAHRAAWILTHGDIPDGLHVLHKCDNRICVNPGHLFLGTNEDNRNDMVSKGRAKYPRGSHHGNSKLTEAQVKVIRLDPRTQGRIATDFGVSRQLISIIKARKSWKHI